MPSAHSAPHSPCDDRASAAQRVLPRPAGRALEIDPQLPEAHQLAAALHYSIEFDGEGAEREYRWLLHPGKVPCRVAAGQVALGDETEALRLLEQAYAQRDNWLNQLKVDPVMDPLRTNPRFLDLIRRLRFP